MKGELLKIIKIVGEIDLRLSKEEFEEAKQEQLDSIDDPEAKKSRANTLSNIPLSKNKLAFSKIMIDEVGNIWIGEHLPNWKEPKKWWVFNIDSQLLGEIEMPTNFRILEIGHDYILGKKTDEDGFECIQIYQLVKP